MNEKQEVFAMKKIGIIFGGLILIVGSITACQKEKRQIQYEASENKTKDVQEMEEMGEEAYDLLINEFSEVSVDDIIDMQEKGEKFFLFTGRKSCDKCIYFVGQLSNINAKENIFYLNSITSYEESPQELKDFRDNYDMQYVPDFRYFDGYKSVEKLEIDGETANGMGTKDIEQFMERLVREK